MIRTKLAKKVLGKKDQQHLTDSGINSMSDMKQQVANMKEMEPDFPRRVCFDCASIADKLKLTFD